MLMMKRAILCRFAVGYRLGKLGLGLESPSLASINGALMYNNSLYLGKRNAADVAYNNHGNDENVVKQRMLLARLCSSERYKKNMGAENEGYEAKKREVRDLQELVKDEKDPHVVRETMAELGKCQEELKQIENEIVEQLVLKSDSGGEEEDNERNSILEFRPGPGGLEASLFAKDLMGIYEKYSLLRGWKFEPLEIMQTELGGIREAVVMIKGSGCFGNLKFESGVHRVQRVPETEGKGRLHTSTASVVVLPEAEEVDIKINDKDLRIDVFRSQGAGGQSVNKTESAVRIVHIPTGITVAMQDERSQQMNKKKAMKILTSRIYEAERKKLHDTRVSARSKQIGGGERSDRIRTYNYQQGRVTDHRIHYSCSLQTVLEGDLDIIIDALHMNSKLEKLEELLETEYKS